MNTHQTNDSSECMKKWAVINVKNGSFCLRQNFKNDTQNFCRVLYWHGIVLLDLIISGKCPSMICFVFDEHIIYYNKDRQQSFIFINDNVW